MNLDSLALLSLALIVSRLLGGLFRKLSLPTAVGEILTGALLVKAAPHLPFNFGSLSNNPQVTALAILGVVLLTFMAALKTELKEVFRSLHYFVALVLSWIVLLGAITFFTRQYWQSISPQVLWTFFAALGSVTLALPSHIARRYPKLTRTIGPIIFGGALVGNILAIFTSSISVSMNQEGAAMIQKIAIVGAELSFFVLGIYFSRILFLPSLIRVSSMVKTEGAFVTLVISTAVLLAWISSVMSLIWITGPFCIGLILSEDDIQSSGLTGGKSTNDIFSGLLDYLVPVFFLWVGMQLNLSLLQQWSQLKYVLAITLCLMAFKGLFVLFIPKSYALNWTDRRVAWGCLLSPGETGLLFASIGLQAQFLSPQQYAIPVAAIVLTLLIGAAMVGRESRKEVPT